MAPAITKVKQRGARLVLGWITTKKEAVFSETILVSTLKYVYFRLYIDKSQEIEGRLYRGTGVLQFPRALGECGTV